MYIPTHLTLTIVSWFCITPLFKSIPSNSFIQESHPREFGRHLPWKRL